MSKNYITLYNIVHYYQVDQMGVMHHAQYVYALEQSRIEWLLNKGVSYGALEKKVSYFQLLILIYNIRSHYTLMRNISLRYH